MGIEALGVALPLDWFINVSVGMRTLYFTGSALLLCLLRSVSVCWSCRQGCRQNKHSIARLLCFLSLLHYSSVRPDGIVPETARHVLRAASIHKV